MKAAVPLNSHHFLGRSRDSIWKL